MCPNLFTTKQYSILHCLLVIVLLSIFLAMIPLYRAGKASHIPSFNWHLTTPQNSLEQRLFEKSKKFTNNKEKVIFETTVECVGSSYNRSCLFKNLYYLNSAFTILTTRSSRLPPHDVRIAAYNFRPLTPNKIVFNTSK